MPETLETAYPDPAPKAAWETAAASAPSQRIRLRLFVAGNTPRSQRAIAAVKRRCEEHLAGRYGLEVVDIYQQPQLTREAQIIAVPTLLRELPQPTRRFVGDLSSAQRAFVRFDLPGGAKPE